MTSTLGAVSYSCSITTCMLKYCTKGSRCTGDLWRSRLRSGQMWMSSWRGFFRFMSLKITRWHFGRRCASQGQGRDEIFKVLTCQELCQQEQSS